MRDVPIRQKLLATIVGTTSLALLLTALVFVVYSWFSVRETLFNNLQAVNEVFALNTTAALSFNDSQAATEILSSLRAKEEVMQACIYRAQADGLQVFAHYRRAGMRIDCPEQPPESSRQAVNILEVVQPIWLGNDRLGSLYIERHLNDLWASSRLNGLVVGAMVIFSTGLAVFLTSFMQRLITQPIQELLKTTEQVSHLQDYSLRATETGRDEVGQLIAGFNDMLGQIERRDLALEAAKSELEVRIDQADIANAELQEALERLRKTQEQLVNTEKMASLGGLVAGVAHEINTPVGIGVTAASTLRVKTEEAGEQYKAGQMTNTGLQKYFEHALQSTEIILSNLHRAADLIHSFKQVAVDQTSSECRQFNVREYIDEILLSLRPKLKKTNIGVRIECPGDMIINSVPGAVSQILTNLVMNSLIHAYSEEQDGSICICVSIEDDEVLLRYSDDGRGMSEANVKRIFDPFFTTRRGSGGSGLGMHIVYNLVTQQLGGTVKVHSVEGEGTEFEIRFPLMSAAGVESGGKQSNAG